VDGFEVESPEVGRDPADVSRRFLPRVYNFCRAVLGSGVDAEDACQETFLAIARHRDELERVARLTPWVLTIARNACRYQRRRRNRASYTELPDDVPTSEGAPFGAADEVAKVRAAIERLPERYRAVLNLHYQQGLAPQEAAEVLEVSEGALRVLLHRAIVKLREEVRRP